MSGIVFRRHRLTGLDVARNGGAPVMVSANDNSFEALALPHLEMVYRVARRLAHDQHEAEDLVQETYFKAFRAFATYEAREFGIKPWLLKILNNTFLNRQARARRAPRAIDQHVLDQSRAADVVVGLPQLDYENLDQEVKQALGSLSPEFRSVILLWGTMEFSYQEIADILELPIGTVMSRLHRARRQLTATLEEFARANRITNSKSTP